MPSMTISAEFPLGTYLGHADVGKRSPFPDTARLFSALVHAASKGSHAVLNGEDLRMSAASTAALRWLEEHPPQLLHQPDVVPVSTRPASAWRLEGVFEKRDSAIRARRVLKHQSGAQAVRGSFEWTWEDVPDGVIQRCGELAPDVSCLGESDSPVLLRVSTDASAPTHRLDPLRTAFPEPGGLPVRTPVTGRLAELEADYEQGRGTKPPSRAADRHSTSQQPQSPTPSVQALQRLTYRPLESSFAAPWTAAILLPVSHSAVTDGQIDAPQEAVGWAVAFHRALAATLGDDAPPSITGSYPRGATRPPNRCAIHYLPADAPVSFAHTGGAFLILLPDDLPGRDLNMLFDALRSIRNVWRRERGSVQGTDAIVDIGEPQLISAEEFWRPVPAGTSRLWAPRVPLIPEIRAHRTRGWDLEQAAQLSVGHVWRRQLGQATGTPRDALVKAVAEHRVGVHNAHLILDSRVSRYVHRVAPGVVVQPYTCVLALGSLASDRAPAAVGQTRHLGGGLLFPLDIALSTRPEGAS